jgi:hypothetical protein
MGTAPKKKASKKTAKKSTKKSESFTEAVERRMGGGY